jgi:hypothetical protein
MLQSLFGLIQEQNNLKDKNKILKLNKFKKNVTTFNRGWEQKAQNSNRGKVFKKGP